MLFKDRIIFKSLSVKKYTSSSHIINPRATQTYATFYIRTYFNQQTYFKDGRRKYEPTGFVVQYILALVDVILTY